MHEMLYTKEMNWTTDVDPMFKNGTFFWRENSELKYSHEIQPRYTDIYEMFAYLFEPGEK